MKLIILLNSEKKNCTEFVENLLGMKYLTIEPRRMDSNSPHLQRQYDVRRSHIRTKFQGSGKRFKYD